MHLSLCGWKILVRGFFFCNYSISKFYCTLRGIAFIGSSGFSFSFFFCPDATCATRSTPCWSCLPPSTPSSSASQSSTTASSGPGRWVSKKREQTLSEALLSLPLTLSGQVNKQQQQLHTTRCVLRPVCFLAGRKRKSLTRLKKFPFVTHLSDCVIC